MSNVQWSGKWHPFAERFPMLSEQELRDMAESIRETGQLHDCVMDPDGLGLDGRNRVAACRIAGIEPRWTVNDGNPHAVIIAANVHHRFLSTGQRAMAVAVELREKGLRQNGRWKRGSVPDAPDNIGSDINWVNRVANAGIVLDWLPEMANRVMAGETALDAAYQRASGKQKTEQARAEKMARLPTDLAALVESGVREIDDALEETKARSTVAQIDKTRDLDGAPPPSFAQRAETGSLSWQEAATLAEEWLQERSDSIERERERIRAVVTGGWTALVQIARDPEHPYAVDILDGLNDQTRDAARKIITQVKETIHV